MEFYEENVFILTGAPGEWDEVSQTPVTHQTHWEDFDSELKPRFSRTVSKERRLRILERDGHQCRSCGSEGDLEVDHMVPVSMGGGDEDGNLQILCRDCNRQKGPKPWSVQNARLEQEGADHS